MISVFVMYTFCFFLLKAQSTNSDNIHSGRFLRKKKKQIQNDEITDGIRTIIFDTFNFILVSVCFFGLTIQFPLAETLARRNGVYF